REASPSGAAFTYDCISTNRNWLTRPLSARDGADGGPTGLPGNSGRVWTLGCDGDGFIGNTSVSGQDGGRGGIATHTSNAAAVAKAGAGGTGALLLVYVTGGLDFGNDNFLNGGSGGNGGTATATSTAHAALPAAPPATA